MGAEQQYSRLRIRPFSSSAAERPQTAALRRPNNDDDDDEPRIKANNNNNKSGGATARSAWTTRLLVAVTLYACVLLYLIDRKKQFGGSGERGLKRQSTVPMIVVQHHHRPARENSATLKPTTRIAPTDHGPTRDANAEDEGDDLAIGFELKEEHQPSKCSCLIGNHEDPSCCDRKILRAHKMGVVLIRDLFLRPLKKHHLESKIIHPDVLTANNKASVDYRHVVITRPWYDSIVSGYLYHKSGRECWLDQDGNPRRVNKTFEWEGSLSKPAMPPRNSRTLCSYLTEESEEDGMRVFVDLSLNSFYAGLVPHRELVHKLETTSDRKTMFVCFGELSNPDTKRATIKKIMDWLYPAGHKFSLPRQPPQQRAYGGGHSTSKDPSLRERLLSLVKKYDQELFDSRGAAGTDVFGCQASSRREEAIK